MDTNPHQLLEPDHPKRQPTIRWGLMALLLLVGLMIVGFIEKMFKGMD
jgi:hypothetical protein